MDGGVSMVQILSNDLIEKLKQLSKDMDDEKFWEERVKQNIEEINKRYNWRMDVA